MIECSIVGLTSLPLMLAAEAAPSHRLEGASSASRGPIRQNSSPATETGAAWTRDSIAGATNQEQTGTHIRTTHRRTAAACERDQSGRREPVCLGAAYRRRDERVVVSRQRPAGHLDVGPQAAPSR